MKPYRGNHLLHECEIPVILVDRYSFIRLGRGGASKPCEPAPVTRLRSGCQCGPPLAQRSFRILSSP